MDVKIKNALNKEIKRQNNNIELIASENFVSKDILELCGSIFTNKYAEGYPAKRYYGGCENVDKVETLAIEYACKLFGCKYANVQPHSGSSANMAVYRALLNKGDKVLGMSLAHGGHLTHGHKINFSGEDYNIIGYKTNKDGEINYKELKNITIKEKPKMIIAGFSAYSGTLDFKKFREIADTVNAYLFVDMAHVAGLIATGLYPNPFPYADVVSSTTHKTLRGPRGAFILTNNEEIAKKIDKTVFPGIQGGPLMHIIAAKAQCFYEALKKDFKKYQSQVLKNSKALSAALATNGFKVVGNKTENHIVLIDVKTSINITGKEAQALLEKINITTNKNMVPEDSESPFITSGLRLGTQAMTTRGLIEEDFIEIANIISECLQKSNSISSLKNRVSKITNKYPLKI